MHQKFSVSFFFLWMISCCLFSTNALAQKAYFIDGYHGGVWGHYPDWNTRFMVDMLQKNPSWKINIEIEPDTWDTAKVKDPEAYNDFKSIFSDQSVGGRIEYVNPSYGQSYLYNISGESMIRQFYYGMKKVKEHFPTAVFTSYSSEEPCFTSALPQVLKSFGYKYASLKNPNTCWGGYTRAFGGELVNWVGPDGTKLVTVPRYAVEALEPNSTWQTISWNNSKAYINAALNYGIKNPVGMCLQDAGWKNGPWLGDGTKGYQPTEYTTWRNYVENASIKKPVQDWKVSQEDMQVSLVWGSQILQKLAQQVRVSENKIVQAEKLAAMATVYDHLPWPTLEFEKAWQPLLLAQHHDCWIVPYNRKHNTNWAGYVDRWTNITNIKADSIIHLSTKAGQPADVAKYVTVYNTTLQNRYEWVQVEISNVGNVNKQVVDMNNLPVPSELVSDPSTKIDRILFKASVPSMGYNTYKLVPGVAKQVSGVKLSLLRDSMVSVETDLYRLIIDPAKGGIIRSLIAKSLGNKEFVDLKADRSFNELRGNFYNDGGMMSSSNQPATVDIVEASPARVKLAIRGKIGIHPYTQFITLVQGQRRIDFSVAIDWIGNPGIGNAYAQKSGWDQRDTHKAFYDDRDKLLLLFPTALSNRKIYKNAPFDVTESGLDNTYFSTWDSIKNNIVLNWVDVTDAKNHLGLALLTDHTTSYVHGKDHPLALTLQYSGMGLWGRNYSITGPLHVNYSLIPHSGNWDKAGISSESEKWNEPLIVKVKKTLPSAGDIEKSLVSTEGAGLQISSVTVDDNNLLVRLFNAEGDAKPKKIFFGFAIKKVELVELNGKVIRELKVNGANSRPYILVEMPKFGFRTLRIQQDNNR